MSSIENSEEAGRNKAKNRSKWYRIKRLCQTYPLGAIGSFIVFLVVFAAVFADFVAPYDPTTTSAKMSLSPPGADMLFGGDMMGRDVLSRIIHGARISLAVGIGSTILGGVIGTIIGLMCGYWMGLFDLLIQRIIDMMQALPLLVMALVMAASLGPSLENTIIAISIPLVPQVARVIRSNVLSLRELPFVRDLSMVVVVKKFNLFVLQFKEAVARFALGVPTLSEKFPLKPTNSCFFKIILSIPAVPSASYLADGEVTTSTLSIDSAGSCLNP